MGAATITFRILRLLDGNLIYDDSFITFRYAENIANGLGFVYNSGDHVLGVTTPLWALILACAGFFGMHVPTASITLGILFDTMTALLLFHTLFLYNKRAGIWAAFIWAIYPPAVSAATGGMETSMFVALSLATLIVASKRKMKPLVALYSVAALFTRPEGVITYLFTLASVLRKWQRNVIPLLVMTITPLIGIILAVMYFGSAIPHSITAKRVAMEAGSTVAEILSGLFPGETLLLLPAVFLGMLVLILRRRVPLIVVWSLTYLALYLLARPKMWVWYNLPMQIGIVVLAAIGLAFAFEQVARLAGKYRKRFDLAIPVIVTCIVVPLSMYYYFPNGPIGVNQESKRFREMAEYVKTSTSIDDAVLASDIGYVGYYSERKILDSWGLVWKEALEFDGTIAERVPQIARQFMPEAVVVPARGPDVRALKSNGWFLKNYEISGKFFKEDVDISEINLDSLPELWSAEYLIYIQKKFTPIPGDSLNYQRLPE